MGTLTTLHVDETIPGIECDTVDETRDEEADDEYQTHVGGVDFLEEVSLGCPCGSRHFVHCQLSTGGDGLYVGVRTAWSC